MGTRSTTTVIDEQGNELICMYRQFDGYLSGHGADLKAKFGDTPLVNGLNDTTPVNAANGMGCFAAQLISAFKGTGHAGSFYIVPLGQREGWDYFLYPKDSRIYVRIANYEFEYDGPLSDLPTQD